MFAALCDNLEFFKPKINLAVMLAPVARVDRMTCKTIQRVKENNTVNNIMESMGPELFPNA